MGAFIVKQPNGRYCRFSTVVDCPTNVNMTRDDYIQLKIKDAVENAYRAAVNVLDKHLYPYEDINKYFAPNNMSEEEFEDLKRIMESPVDEDTEMLNT